MAKKSFLAPIFEEEEDILGTLKVVPSEELQNKKIELPPYDPLDPSTYTSARPQFLRYRSNRKAYDEDFYENSEGIEQIQRSPCFKIKFLILVAALFVFIVCVSAWHSSKLYGDPNRQSLNEYADRFGLPIGEILEEMYLPINEYAYELGQLINKDTDESGFRINEIYVYEALGLGVLKHLHTIKFEDTKESGFGINEIGGDEAHGLAVLKQRDTLNFEDMEESGFGINEIDGDEAHGNAVLRQLDTIKFEDTCFGISEIDGDEVHGLAVLKQLDTLNFEDMQESGSGINGIDGDEAMGLRGLSSLTH